MVIVIEEYLEKYKKEFKQLFEDISHKDTFYKQIPNLLTLSRAIGIIPINILFLTGNVIPAFILTGLLLSTDFFDGKIARKYNLESKFGADLDAFCDKIMVGGFIIPLVISNPMVIFNIMLELGISIVNVLGRMKGVDTKTVKEGKIKTWFLSLTILISYLSKFLGWSPVIALCSSLLTVGVQSVTMERYIDEYERMIKVKNLENDCSQDIEQDVKESLDKEDNKLIDQLKREKEFLLASMEPGRVYTGKKKARMRLQEKKNS